jgi:hypothetical protein
MRQPGPPRRPSTKRPSQNPQKKKLILDGDYNFTVEKNKRANGPEPINLLTFGFATPVYLSDRNLTPAGGPAHQGLLKTWGYVDTNIEQTPGSGVLGTIETADLELTIINSQNPRFSDNFTDDDPPENVTVDLYQWFAPLQYQEKKPIFKGIIYGQPKYDEYTCTITIRAIFQKFNIKIGDDKIITASVFPDADPDDIGKMSNIIYGSLIDVPCRALKAGAIDTITADMASSDTSFYVSGSSAAEYPSGTVVVQIDDEQIQGTYNQTTNRFTSCTRGYNSTTATTHSKGASVAEILTQYIYEVAGHPVKAITAVRVDGVAQTSGFTAYTGQTGSILTGYEGRAVIVFTALAMLTKQVNLTVSTGSHSHTESTYITISWFFDGASIVSGSPLNIVGIVDKDLSSQGDLASGDSVLITKSIQESYEGIPIQFRTCLRVGSPNDVTTLSANCGGSVASGATSNTTYYGGWVTLSNKTFADLMTYTATITRSGSGLNGYVGEVWLEIRYNATTASSAATGVAISGNSTADTVIGTAVTVDAAGYQDDANGTYTGTASALITQPDDIFKHIWAVLLGAPIGDIDPITFNASSAFYAANSYAFSFLIDNPIQATDLLMKLALQCRSRFIVNAAGQAKLIIRQLDQASGHSIIQNEIKRDSMSIQRSPTTELINSFSVGYDLDLSQSSGSLSSFRSALTFTDSTSIGRYGTRNWQGSEDVFCFDAIRLAAMAQDVGAFLLAYHCRVRKMPTFGVFLDNMEIQPADIIDLTHNLDNMIGFVVEVLKIIYHIGNRQQNDWLEITGIENAS